MNPVAPVPDAHESFERYSIRANRALAQAVPDHDERLQLIQYTWRQHRGATPVEKVAERLFAPDKYDHAPNVCIFAEHDTVDQQGQPRHYGLKELAQIVRYNNQRMHDRHAFAALADGHTSNPGDANPVKPKTVGYSGPQRLGLLPDNKTWGVFHDEYRFPEAKDAFRDKNRRSVELWRDNRNGHMWFDPVTLCGADAPRLALPAHYQQVERDGLSLERYNAGAAPDVEHYDAGFGGYASINVGNASPRELAKFDATCGPPSQSKKPERYETGEQPMFEGGDVPDALLNRIVEALLATPQMKWVAEQMTQTPPGPDGADDDLSTATPSAADSATPAAVGAAPTPQPPGASPAGNAPGNGDDDDDLSDLDDLLSGGGDDESAPPVPHKPEPVPPEKKTMAYTQSPDSGISVEQYTALRGEYAQLKDQYTALHNAQTKLVQDHGRNLTRLQSLERESADAKRTARLTQFAADHPQFPLDDDDRKPAMYSLGGTMTDEQFESHMATLERYAARFVPQVRIPTGEAPQGELDKEQYEAKLSRTAVQIYSDSLQTDKPLNYEQAIVAAKAKLA